MHFIDGILIGIPGKLEGTENSVVCVFNSTVWLRLGHYLPLVPQVMESLDFSSLLKVERYLTVFLLVFSVELFHMGFRFYYVLRTNHRKM